MSEHEVNKYERFVNDYLLNKTFYFVETKFSLYKNSVEYGISVGKIESSINYLEEIILESVVDFDMENELKTVSELLNDEELKHVKEKLLDFLENYHETEDELQNHSSCLKIINLYDKFVDLQQPINDNEILSLEEWECISDYLISIVNNNKIEEINRVCYLIDNSPNGIDRTLVDFLLQLIPEREKSQQPMGLMELMEQKIEQQMKQEMEQGMKQQIEQQMTLTEIIEQIEQMKQKSELASSQENATQNNSVPPQENLHEHQEEK